MRYLRCFFFFFFTFDPVRSDSFSLDLETRYKSRLAATVELAISKSNAHRAVFIMALCACGDGLVVAL